MSRRSTRAARRPGGPPERSPWLRHWTIGFSLLVVACSQGSEREPNVATIVEAGKQVSLEYVLRVEGDETEESNAGEKPLTYVHGNGEILPGLEAALEGMTIGERKHVLVPPEDGYGLVDPERVQEVPKNLVAPEARQAGATVQTRGPHGEQLFMSVKEVREETIMMDFNHPLAGKTLSFDVTVVDIK